MWWIVLKETASSISIAPAKTSRLMRLYFSPELQDVSRPSWKEQRIRYMEKPLMAGTKLVFIPEVGRDPTAPLSLQKETFIVHRGVFLTPGQFAVLVVKFIKARGDPLPYHWLGRK